MYRAVVSLTQTASLLQVGMGPNQTTVERFKALVKLGESLPNPLMLGQYTCLQQMKTINATNKNQCKPHRCCWGSGCVCQGGVCQRFRAAILRTGIGPAGTPAPAPKAGVYKGADMATTEHRQFRESLVEWIAQVRFLTEI